MSIFKDIQLAFRLLRQAPSATLIALLSIALSVGATAVVFAAIKSVLLDPLPYVRAGELVQLRSEFPAIEQQPQSDWALWTDTQEWLRRTRTVESIGVYRNAVFDLAGNAGGPPEALYGLRMTASLFRTLGVSPMLGRNILAQEDQPGHAEEMILSYGLWARRFNSDPTIVGRTVTINGHQCLVIGVMTPEFNFPLRRQATRTPAPYVEFWAPLSTSLASRQGALGAVARLKKGVSLAEARQDLDSISSALAREFPQSNRDHVLKLNFLRDRTVGTAASGLLLLLAAALLFLLAGCANVANLLLVRGLARQREINVRLALGASPGRIVRQLLTESCVLAVLGGVAAYVLTVVAWKILPSIAPVSIPRLAAAHADSATFWFSLAVAILNGLLFGIAPALRLAGKGVMPLTGLGTRGAVSGGQDRVRSLLVVVEVAVSVVVVLTGSQLLGSFRKLIGTDPGFQPKRILASVVLPAAERYKSPEARGLFYRRILEAVQRLPGVESAGTVDALPFSGENNGGMVSAIGASDARPMMAEVDVAGGDYLQAMGIRLLQGRWFREEDMSPSGDAAILNEIAAGRLWPSPTDSVKTGTSPIGQRICVFCTPENPNNWKRVVGVVSTMNHAALNEAPKSNVYLAAAAMDTSDFVVVRTSRPAAEMENAIRSAIAALDPNQPVLFSASLADLISDSVAGRRFLTILLTITACLALILSAGGIYGVISYTTSRRTAEIGIRMAVGATPQDVLALMFRQGFSSVAVGLIAGVAASVFLGGSLRSLVPGLETTQPIYFWTAASLVTLTAGIACLIPASRASRTEPISALRLE